MNESTQIILQKIDFQKILNGIERTDLFVRLEMLVEQVQNLPSPNSPSLTGLCLLEVEDLPGKFSLSHLRKCGKELRV